MEGLVIVIVIVALAVFFLRGFDRMAGRGPKQVKDGINRARQAQDSEGRVPCPQCAELILPTAKKCRFCGSDLMAGGSA